MRGSSRVWVFAVLVALGACGGGSGPAPGPDPACPAIGLPTLTTQQLGGPTPQVHIEMKFVTVNETQLENLGIDWRFLTDVDTGFDPANGAANCGPAVGVSTSLVGGAAGQIAVLPFQQAGMLPMPMVRTVPVLLGDGAQAYNNLGGVGAFQIAAIAQQSLDGLVSAPSGILVTPQILTSNSAISYLLTDDGGATMFTDEVQLIALSRILVVPPVTVMNNQSTTAFGPTETPTPADLTEPMRSQVTGLDPSIPNVEVGVALRVTPTVPQPGTIQLDIEPGLEFVSAVPQTVFQLNGSVDSATQVPIVRTAGQVSRILINDGNTVILGGIRDNVSMQTTLGVPIFANLPVVGAFLREHKQLDLREALVILIKAEIVGSP